jgi:hypothetical protein
VSHSNIRTAFFHTLLQTSQTDSISLLESRKEQRQKYLDSVVRVHQVFLVTIARLPSCPSPTNSNRSWLSFRGSHSVRPRRPIHRRVKWLSRNKRKRNARCSGTPSWYNSRQYEIVKHIQVGPIYFQSSCTLNLSSRDFRLPPRCSWVLRPSGL